MKYLASLLLLALPAVAAIEGTVVNKTTGKPQAGVSVTLTKLGQGGMAPAGTTKSGANGVFKLDASAQDAHLLHAQYQGVTYNQQLPPGSTGTGVEVAVYEASAKGPAAPEQHMILVETDGTDVVVHETLVYNNTGNTTWYDEQRGTARFFAPAEAGDEVKARAMAPGGMPIERAPKKTGTKEVWMIDYPVRPGGETRFDISYKLPAKSPLAFRARILHETGTAQLVLPEGIKPEGEGLTLRGQEPSSHAMIYEIAKQDLTVSLTGTGQLNSLQPTQPTEQDGPRIEEIQPPGFARYQYWILGLMLSILALSFAAQYLKGAPGQR